MTTARDCLAELSLSVLALEALGQTEIPCRAPGCSVGNLPPFLCLLPASWTKANTGITAAVPLSFSCICLAVLP